MNATYVSIEKNTEVFELYKELWGNRGISGIRADTMTEAIEKSRTQYLYFIDIVADDVNFMPQLAILAGEINVPILMATSKSNYTEKEHHEAMNNGAHFYAPYCDEPEMNINGTIAAVSSYDRIAKTLANEKIPTPTAYAGGAIRTDYHSPCDWHYSAVRTILSNPTYLGHTVQGRYTSVSFKVKKAIKVPENQWIWVENTHKAIISKQVWDMVQGIIHKRKRSVKNGEPHIFAGLLRCYDCGNTLAKNAKDIFSCWQYKTKGKEHCTNHHITLEKLTTAVLVSIREVSAEVRDNRDAFIGRLSGIGERQKRQKTDAARKERDKLARRLAEIPGLVKMAFEQNAGGKLPDGIYAEMMDGYKQEREELTTRLDTLNATVTEAEQESAGINEFMGLVEKYIDIQELDRAIVHELIEKIVVHQAQKLDGQRTQQIDIYYRFIGKIE